MCKFVQLQMFIIENVTVENVTIIMAAVCYRSVSQSVNHLNKISGHQSTSQIFNPVISQSVFSLCHSPITN